MKRILSLTGLILSIGAAAQNSSMKCGTNYSLEQRANQTPALWQQRQRAENEAYRWLQDNAEHFEAQRAVVTIPTVVHIVYNTGDSAAQNVPDSVIFSQIDVLNQDFRRMNADTGNLRPIFDSIAADVEVEFCLATVDPLGNATTGINRVPTSHGSFWTSAFDNDIKSTSAGGQDPWPRDDYLNIWVCDMSFGGNPFLLGYAQFPGDDPTTDGVVVQYSFFGRANDPNLDPLNYGRTTTHEVGHWLGLYHIWGDGDCTASDSVPDTPNADAASQTDCDTSKNTCDDSGGPFWQSVDPPDLVENYMDYSTDVCMNTFTLGQKARVWSFLNTDRLPLQTSNGCSPSGLKEDATDISFKVYPIPTDEQITIEIPVDITTGYQVLDLSGRVLLAGTTRGELTNLDISPLSSGAYLLQITLYNRLISKPILIK